MIVDDHTLFRAGLVGILKEVPEIDVVGEASNGQEAVAQAQELMPDVILMDLCMSPCDGLEATRQIKKVMPYVNIVILTASEKDEDLFGAMKAGARGYILKTETPEELVSVINFAARGHVVISPEIAEKLLLEFGTMAENQGDAAAIDAKLTKREKEILLMVAEGLNNREIGRRLFLSEGTIKTHLRNILDKLHLRNRMEAVAFAAKQGLLEDERKSQAMKLGS